MKNFKNLRIWQTGYSIAIDTYKLLKTFPTEERFGLSRQIAKAAVSIPSNIAEGSSRNSQKDYGHFIEISLGSSFELETQILIADSLDFGDHLLRASILKNIEKENIMLHSFLSTLKK
ncbi:MAG: four helix bundle protein [Flavisolibacter sp.]